MVCLWRWRVHADFLAMNQNTKPAWPKGAILTIGARVVTLEDVIAYSVVYVDVRRNEIVAAQVNASQFTWRGTYQEFSTQFVTPEPALFSPSSAGLAAAWRKESLANALANRQIQLRFYSGVMPARCETVLYQTSSSLLAVSTSCQELLAGGAITFSMRVEHSGVPTFWRIVDTANFYPALVQGTCSAAPGSDIQLTTDRLRVGDNFDVTVQLGVK